MLKTDSLREAMTRSCRWCQANPEKFTIFVESGNIETTGETPSFVYRYQMVMFVMDYAGELDDCIDSLEVRKKPGGHWIIRDLAGLDLVGLASL